MTRRTWVASRLKTLTLGALVALASGRALPAADPPPQEGDAVGEFERRYRLAPGEDLKRVAPPFPESRTAYFNAFSKTRGAGAVPADQIRFLQFRQVGDVLGTPGFVVGPPGGRGRSLGWLLTHLAGVDSQDAEGRTGLLEAVVDGDFVVRKGVPVERLVDRLGVILRDECEIPVRLRFREVVRDVVVARGAFRYRPPEAGNVQGHDPSFEIYGLTRSDNGIAGGDAGSFEKLLRSAGGFAEPKVRVVNEATGLPPGGVTWTFYARSPADEPKRREDHDRALVFEHLAEQTGLTFAMDERKVNVLFVDPAAGPGG